MADFKTPLQSRSTPSSIVSNLLRWKKTVCVALAVCSVASIAIFQNSTTDIFSRMLSSAYEQCEVFTITIPSQPIIPIYAASYPGSGSQMTHYLFEAITGLEAGDEHLHRGDQYDMITIKTHYPARPHTVQGNRLMQKVILLLRNPLHSIPSYHNFLYEEENDIPNHTVKAPVESWNKWRDEHVEEEIQKWKDHAKHWMDEYETKDRLVISYERLTNNKLGPIETARLSNFLSRQDSVKVVAPSKIPCVWDKVINYNRVDIDKDGKEITPENARKLTREAQKVNRHLYTERGDKINAATEDVVKRRVKYVSKEDPSHPLRSKRKGNQKYEFRMKQLIEIRSMLNGLRAKYLDEYTFVVIISTYLEEVNMEIKKLEERS